MEKIKLGLFDVFGFILPGMLITFAFNLPFLTDQKCFSEITDVITKLKEIPVSLLLLLLCYIVGASIHQIGFIWYYFAAYICSYFILTLVFKTVMFFNKTIGDKKLKELKEKFNVLRDKSYIMEGMVLIRQFTPEQLPALEEWTSKRAMSFNLSFSFLILAITIYLTVLVKYRTFGSYIIIFSLIAAFMLLVRAYGYDYWWKTELKVIIEKFDLNNKKLGDRVS